MQNPPKISFSVSVHPYIQLVKYNIPCIFSWFRLSPTLSPRLELPFITSTLFSRLSGFSTIVPTNKCRLRKRSSLNSTDRFAGWSSIKLTRLDSITGTIFCDSGLISIRSQWHWPRHDCQRCWAFSQLSFQPAERKSSTISDRASFLWQMRISAPIPEW